MTSKKTRDLGDLVLVPDEEMLDGRAGKMLGEIPEHVAIIMDGNGRWASQRKRPRLYGHQKGVAALKRTVEGCLELGIKFLTVYAFSTENWRRPETEILGLMTLLKKTIKAELKNLHEQGIRLLTIGRRDRLSPDLLSLIDEALDLTKDNENFTLVIAIDYGGRDDILAAARLIASKVRSGDLSPSDITEKVFSEHLYTASLPDPDLFIRTSDVLRLSNFLVWQTAYTELVFLKTYWPDFDKEHLRYAVAHFQGCERKFGRASLPEGSGRDE